MSRKPRAGGPEASVLAIDTPQLFAAAVKEAARLLHAGEVVALPTETVYGLAANALSTEAVAKIFELKGRPRANPIIVHVANLSMARDCVAAWPPLADKLAHAFWPGPLTLVMPRGKTIPPLVTAGGPTVGVRWPSHPFMQAVIGACGFPLAAPSANPSNRVSPTNASHVQKYFGGRIGLIVDGGQSQVGIESTVLDLTVSPPQVLRPGMIHEPALVSVTGELASGDHGSGVLKSPGLLPKHYAPRAKVAIWSWKSDQELEDLISHSGVDPGRIHVVAHTHIPGTAHLGRVSVIPHDPEAFARAIYAELHHADDLGAELIVLEEVPQTAEWGAVRDRLNRAASS